MRVDGADAMITEVSANVLRGHVRTLYTEIKGKFNRESVQLNDHEVHQHLMVARAK
jgi:hypothetical protein